jgi:hypothetical protein
MLILLWWKVVSLLPKPHIRRSPIAGFLWRLIKYFTVIQEQSSYFQHWTVSETFFENWTLGSLQADAWGVLQNLTHVTVE